MGSKIAQQLKTLTAEAWKPEFGPQDPCSRELTPKVVLQSPHLQGGMHVPSRVLMRTQC